MDTILIIDDEQTIRMLLSRILELEGYEVFQAKDRASGLEMLKKHEVQVILCDVFLPDGNGVIMVPELKKLPHKLISSYLQHTEIFLMVYKPLKMVLLTILLKVMTTEKSSP